MPPILAVYLDNLNPYAIGWVRWYGLSYLLGFFLAYLVIRRVTKVGISPLKPVDIGDMVTTLAIGIVIGGRLGYVLFYDHALLWDFGRQFPFWGVLRINAGGMASHGGMIGGIVASWLYARRRRVSWAHVLDLMAFSAPLGLFFGRIANFINGELYGRPCSPTLPWAVKFPQEMFTWDAGQLLHLAPVLPYLPPPAHPFPPDVPLPDVIYYSLDRILAAIQHHNPNVIALVKPLLTPRHPSQLYEALLEGLLLLVVLLVVWARPRKPLVVGATFCIVYAVVRIIGEQFRMPDEIIMNQEYAHWHVTRGQLLSVLLLIAGVVLLVLAQRRPVARLGGWRRSSPAPEKADNKRG